MAKDKTDIDIPAPTGVSMIKIKKGDTVYPIKLYSTEAETGTPVDGGVTDTLKLRMGDTTYYARMTTNVRSDVAGGYTPLRYRSASGNVYQVTQKGEFAIIVPASSNQTVCVSANGQTYKGANTLWFAEGTVWSAWVEPDVSHVAGNLNITGGTLNSTITLSVTPVTKVPSGSIHYWSDDQSFPQTFTVPNHIIVLSVHETTRNTPKATHNYRVTPGKSYQITQTRYRHKSGGSYTTTKTLYFNGTKITAYTGYHQAEFEISWGGTINTYATEADFS